jgi:hypothetical protein
LQRPGTSLEPCQFDAAEFPEGALTGGDVSDKGQRRENYNSNDDSGSGHPG